MPQLVITAVGPDKPGIVGELTGRLHAGGANILDSRMVNLRGQFAVIVLVEADEAAAGTLRAGLPASGAAIGLTVSIAGQQAGGAGAARGVPYKIKTYSMDQPGIVHRVTDVLRKHAVNIEDLEARQESAAFAGTPLFIMEMHVTVPPGVGVRALRQELEAACEKINCDLDMEPA
jgi:glycine cleavage system transcriptional repressor